MSQTGSYDPWDDVIDALDAETCPHAAHDRCIAEAANVGITEAGLVRAQAQKQRSRAEDMRRYRARKKLRKAA